MEDSSIATYYYQQLKDSTNKVKVLGIFCSKVFNVQDDKDVFSTMAKLYRIYGSELVFFSILDCIDVPNIDEGTIPYSLISYFAKRRLKNKFNFTSTENLQSLISKVDRLSKRKRKLKIPQPFEEEEND